MKKELIRTEKLSKSYINEGVQTHVLVNIDMTIYEGDFTVVMGNSGSGKSTLLYCISGMDKLTGGQVYVEGNPLKELKESQLALLRTEKMGFVFQQMHLIQNLTLFENVIVSGYLKKKQKTAAVHQRGLALLTQVGMEAYKDRYPSQVSGGQQQRAAIARALINQPAIIFADEPTGALNSSAGKEILDTLTERSTAGQSIVMVTHDIKAALRGNRLIYVKDGQILGEFSLPRYTEASEVKHREAQILSWLQEMGW